jgi:hypothetical protein
MGRYDGRNAYRDDGGFAEFAKFTNLRTSPSQVNLRGARKPMKLMQSNRDRNAVPSVRRATALRRD